MTRNGWKFKGRTVCGIALVCFAAGSLMSARVARIQQARANSNRIFELRVYHVVPGKMPALKSRFRDSTSKILAKHNLNGVGYWVSENSPASDEAFVWILAHASREEAQKNWDAMRVDPEFQALVESEQADKLVEKVDSR